MKIDLTWDEISFAANIGVSRHIKSKALGLEGGQRFATASYHDWSIDIDGALAEMAAAKVLDMYWAGAIRSFSGPDLGKLQIRSTRNPNGSLIIRPGDNGTFVLVIIDLPSFFFPGFISAEEASRTTPLSNPGNRDNGEAYFVKQKDLYHILTLKEQRWTT